MEETTMGSNTSNDKSEKSNDFFSNLDRAIGFARINMLLLQEEDETSVAIRQRLIEKTGYPTIKVYKVAYCYMIKDELGSFDVITIELGERKLQDANGPQYFLSVEHLLANLEQLVAERIIEGVTNSLSIQNKLIEQEIQDLIQALGYREDLLNLVITIIINQSRLLQLQDVTN